MCAHDDAGPYHQHTLKEKKKSKKQKEVKEKNVHMHISFLIMMDNPGYENFPNLPIMFMLVCVGAEATITSEAPSAL